MIDDIVEFMIFMFIEGGAFFTVLFLALLLWTAGPEKWGCEDFGQGMGLETEFKFWHGCFVKMPDGEVLPVSIARKVLEQRYAVKVN